MFWDLVYWQLYQLYQFYFGLRLLVAQAPEASGIWGEVFWMPSIVLHKKPT